MFTNVDKNMSSFIDGGASVKLPSPYYLSKIMLWTKFVLGNLISDFMMKFFRISPSK